MNFNTADIAGITLFYRVRYFDGGHFVLDENAEAIIETFSR